MTPMLIVIKENYRELKRQRRKIEADRRRIDRELRKIGKELSRIYPQPELVEAYELLLDLDYVWKGDFDYLRHPLADLLLKVNQAGLFPDDVKRITRILLHENA
jgi:hypothetical protein